MLVDLKSKKMKKQLSKLFLLAAILGFAACGGNDSKKAEAKEEVQTDVGQEVKDELIEVKAEVAAMDSMKKEIDSAANEVDDLLKEL